MSPAVEQKCRRAWQILKANPERNSAAIAESVGVLPDLFSKWKSRNGHAGEIFTIRAKRFLPLRDKRRQAA